MDHCFFPSLLKRRSIGLDWTFFFNFSFRHSFIILIMECVEIDQVKEVENCNEE